MTLESRKKIAESVPDWAEVYPIYHKPEVTFNGFDWQLSVLQTWFAWALEGKQVVVDDEQISVLSRNKYLA